MVGGSIVALACLLVGEPVPADATSPVATTPELAPPPAAEPPAAVRSPAPVLPQASAPVGPQASAPLVHVRPRLESTDLYDPWAAPVQSVVPRPAPPVSSSVGRSALDQGLLDPWAIRATSQLEPRPVDPDLRHPFVVAPPTPSRDGRASASPRPERGIDLRDPFARAVPRAPEVPSAGVLTSPDLRDPFSPAGSSRPVAPTAPAAPSGTSPSVPNGPVPAVPAAPAVIDPWCRAAAGPGTSPSTGGRCPSPTVGTTPRA